MKADDLARLKSVLEVAEGLKPSLQDRRSVIHCELIAGSAKQYIRFLSYRVEVTKLAELRDAGDITLDEFNRRKDEIPDWRRLDTSPGASDCSR
jgi:hypothetical protein